MAGPAHAVPDGAGNEIFIANVGVGSFAPGQKLDIQGSVRAFNFIGSGAGLTGAIGGWTLAGANLYSTTGSDNVGIGTVSPANSQGLSVLGGASIGSYATITAPGGGLIASGNVGVGTAFPSTAFQVGVNALSVNTANGNVGIGTVTPANTQGLSVLGGVSIGSQATTTAPAGGLLVSGNVGVAGVFPSAAFQVGTNGFIVNTTNGNVGIGTVSPANLQGLSVLGGVSLGTYATTSAPPGGLLISGNVGVGVFPSAALQVGVNALLVNSSSGNVGIGTLAPNGVLDVEGTLNPVIFNATSGAKAYNVGIGSFAPGQKLDVTGTIRAVGLTMSGQTPQSGYVLTASDTARDTAWTSPSNISAGGWTVTGANLYTTNTSGNVGIGTTIVNQAALTVMNGNVGIGTWAPNAALSVMNGNVGIGTATPSYLFEIKTNASTDFGFSGSAESFYRVSNNAQATSFSFQKARGASFSAPASVNSGDLLGGVQFAGYDGTNYLLSASITSSVDATPSAGVVPSALNFTTTNTLGNLNQVMKIDNAGNVGIGTTTPAGALIVMNGNVGIGTWVPTEYLHILGGNVRIDSSHGYIITGVGQMNENASGGLRLTGGGVPITFETSNIERVRIDSVGNVGIGTSAPGGELIVQGGNVGIGTNVPGQALDVTGTVRMKGFNFSNGAGTGKVLTSDANGNGTWGAAVGSNFWLNTTAAGNVGVSTTNTVGIGTTSAGAGAGLLVMNGNVGVGTWVPVDLFQVGKNSSSSSGFEVDSNGNVGIGTTITSNGSVSVMEGNVGIGTWVPGANLDVEGTFSSTAFAGGVVMGANNAGTKIALTNHAIAVTGGSGSYGALQVLNTTVNEASMFMAAGITSFNSSGTPTYSNGNYAWSFGPGSFGTPPDHFNIDGIGVAGFTVLTLVSPSGNVGVGSANPGKLFDVFGNARLANSGNLTVSGLVSCAGVQTSAAGLMSCTSDARLKDIHGSFNQGLASILKIHPKIYSWKKSSYLYDGGVGYIGFIAQDVEKVLPEAVNTGAKGYKQISTTTILAAAVNAIKDLDKKINDLIKGLSDRIQALEAQFKGYDKIISDVKQLKSDIKKLRQENVRIIKETTQIKEENDTLKTRNKEFEERLKELEEKTGNIKK